MKEGSVSFLRKQESRLLCACLRCSRVATGLQATWTPATFWIPAFAGMTQAAPSPGLAFGQPGLSRGGEMRIASFG